MLVFTHYCVFLRSSYPQQRVIPVTTRNLHTILFLDDNCNITEVVSKCTQFSLCGVRTPLVLELRVLR